MSGDPPRNPESSGYAEIPSAPPLLDSPDRTASDLSNQIEMYPTNKPAETAETDDIVVNVEPEVTEVNAEAGENGDSDEIGNRCPICWESMEDPTLQKTTTCEHTFHTICIDHWLETHNTCPACRTELFEQRLLEPDIDYLFRCWNIRCCLAPTFRQVLQVRKVITGVLWIIFAFALYGYIGYTAKKFNDHPFDILFLIFDSVFFITLSYELICLFFRCRWDTGRMHRLEIDELNVV